MGGDAGLGRGNGTCKGSVGEILASARGGKKASETQSWDGKVVH